MSTEQTLIPPKKRSFLRGFYASTIGILFLLSLAFGFLIFVAMDRAIAAPEWVRDQIVERVNAASPDFDIKFGTLELSLNSDWHPQARVRNVEIINTDGAEIISFSEADVQMSLGTIIAGEIKPERISISGVVATLLRDEEGKVSLRGGNALTNPSKNAANLPALIEQLDAAFELPELSALEIADIQALTLRYEDARAKRVWVVDGGRLRLNHDGDQLTLSADLAVLSGGTNVATLEANYSSQIGDKRAEFGVNISDIAAQDIALQSPALAWLGVLRAPISGALRSGVSADGTFAPLNATLQISQGVVQPTDAAQPIPFSSIRSYFTYRPSSQIIDFDELSVESKWFTANANGQAYLGGLENGTLKDLEGQISLSSIALNPNELYETPAQFESAGMDFRLALDPFEFQIGRVQISDAGQLLQVKGGFTTDSEGWNYALDGQMDAIAPDRLLALWPKNLVAPTRNWLTKNLLAGELSALDVALRGGADQRTNAFFSFNYDKANVRFLQAMPPVHNASGHVSMISNRLVAVVDQGQVKATQGGLIDVAGTAFIIPDITIKGGVPAQVKLTTDSSVTAALSMLNAPNLQVMDKAGLPVTLATGRAKLSGSLNLPLRKGLKLEDVTYDATGTLLSVQADGLVPDKQITSDQLQINATNTGVRIWGPGRVGEVGFDAQWSQAIGADQGGTSEVKGTVEISQTLIDEFDIGLPNGTINGSGQGDLTLKLVNGSAPAITLVSDLRNVGLVVPSLGWRKSTNSTGNLSITGRLGAQPVVDDLQLVAPGLTARGTVTTKASGGLDRASFSQVTVGNWLRAPVVLVGQGAGAPLKIDVSGGSLDLRSAEFGQGGGQGGGEGGPMDLRLDRLQITDTLALTDMRGDFTTKAGLDGRFTAKLNGGTPISGQILPQNGRSAVRITATDAGGVLASGGLLKQARGGDLSLTLLPVGKGGAFDGQLRIENTRIKDAPAIAALLNAVSVVGLLEQMNGSGIHFSEVEAAFRLTPSTMTLTQASAVGPSMGISMDGIYNVDAGTLDMQGVISPIFLLNGIGSILTRKGEGLIGFNYGLRGPATSPKVSINPLSAFTPGMFRKIFRAPAPKVPKVEGESEAPASAEQLNVFSDLPEEQIELTPAEKDAAAKVRQREIDLQSGHSAGDR